MSKNNAPRLRGAIFFDKWNGRRMVPVRVAFSFFPPRPFDALELEHVEWNAPLTEAEEESLESGALYEAVQEEARAVLNAHIGAASVETADIIQAARDSLECAPDADSPYNAALRAVLSSLETGAPLPDSARAAYADAKADAYANALYRSPR